MSQNTSKAVLNEGERVHGMAADVYVKRCEVLRKRCKTENDIFIQEWNSRLILFFKIYNF